ncbi:hypothetical protein Rsub_04120 [Raphidocelis subcapitata]|uniref:Uncharacterized protein n=1 Tax=Raphidocelis subcapitata TaxID=307507 RepID=A0A2V0P0L3_9CHLO|nr:hypothetical protein Rsub_04120 [Raphidocelis subcapitata]|eukprot:GBF91380.1 hypothetical protein Rsub_04120 [Raphidocelis subcapitata]
MSPAASRGGKRGRAPGGAAATAADDAPPGGLTALHRWRSPPWTVAPVTALAACPDGTAVAAAYENGRVEVWHLAHLCRLASIPGWDGADLSSLAWARDPEARRWRLFAGSLDGAVYEVDFDRQQLVHASDSYGGAVWALAARPAAAGAAGGEAAGAAGGGEGEDDAPQELVAACDDGSLRVLRVSARGAGCEYVRSVARTEGRALSVAWHPEGRAVVSGGSDGCIHVWDYASGRELMRITAAVRSAAPPCVWALAVLPDGTIVSGDSDGATQFWEGRFGALITRLQQHVADVMAVAASADGRFVYSAGADPRVAVFARVRDGASGAERWSYLAHKSPHSHEVRALAATARGAEEEELLLSGGVDGQLVAYPALRITQEHPVRLSKAPQAPLLELAPRPAGGAPRLLLAQGRSVTLWRVGRAAARPAGAAAATGAQGQGQAHVQEGDPLDLVEPPACIAELKLRGPRHAACAAVSPDGACVAVSDAGGVRLFAVDEAADGAVAVRRIRGGDGAQQWRAGGGGAGGGVGALPPPAVCMAFAADGGAVFCADAAGWVRRVDAQTGCVTAAVRLEAGGGGAAAAAAPPRRGSEDGDGGEASGSGSGSGSGSDSDDDDAPHAARHAPASAPRSAAAAAQPAISRLVASPDGRWLAAASGAGVQVLALSEGGGVGPAGPLLLLGDAADGGAPPVTALAFGPDGDVLAVANAADGLAAYSLPGRAPTKWSGDHSEPLARLLGLLPGTIERLSFAPAGRAGRPARSVLAQSAGGVAHFDLEAPLSAEALDAKRRRGPHKPRPGSAAAAAGRNGRVLPLDSPCLFLGYIGPAAALLVEKPWEDVTAGLPAPLYRHKYGT